MKASEKMKKKKITEKEQEIAAEILTAFMFTINMDDVHKTWQTLYDAYELCDDPFTGTPCSLKEYCKNKTEYEKQTMIERYGHCDGYE